jgi:hypothetical protein
VASNEECIIRKWKDNYLQAAATAIRLSLSIKMHFILCMHVGGGGGRSFSMPARMN